MQAPTSDPTLGDAQAEFVSWLGLTQDLTDHTLRAYRSDTQLFVESLGTDRPVSSLTSSSIEAFFESQRLAGRRSTTLRRRASGVRRFCDFLVRDGQLEASPWSSTAITFRRVRTLPRAISSHDVNRLVRLLCDEADLSEPEVPPSLPDLHRATTLLAVSLMVTTGMRVGELVSCCAADVDIPAGTIRLMGKGRRERIVFLTDPWIQALVAAYLAAPRPPADHGRLLVNLHGEPLSTASVRARLAKAATAAGLSQTVTPHMLRHTAATQLIESGVDIRFVQRLLGHASLTTTELYTHVSNDALRRAVCSAQVLTRSLEPCA